MRSKTSFPWLACFLILTSFIRLQAKDEEVRMSSPSKVESAKGKERAKLFTKWMSADEAVDHNDEMWKQGQQLIYFEYDSGRNQWRLIFTKKMKLQGQYSWWASIDEAQMESKLNAELKKGLEPAFIVKDNGGYAMMFVSPQDVATVRTELKELGVSEPKLKK